MLIDNKQRARKDEITVNVQGSNIQFVININFLGIASDNKLNFSEHINITSKKRARR